MMASFMSVMLYPWSGFWTLGITDKYGEVIEPKLQGFIRAKALTGLVRSISDWSARITTMSNGRK